MVKTGRSVIQANKSDVGQAGSEQTDNAETAYDPLESLAKTDKTIWQGTGGSGPVNIQRH